MKTKLALFFAVLAVALFGTGCASISQRPLGMPPKGNALSCKNGGGVIVKDSVDLIGDKDITIAFFCNPYDGKEKRVGNGSWLIVKRPYGQGSYLIAVSKKVVLLSAWFDSTTKRISRVVEHDFNEWYHVCWVFNSSEGTSSLYLNGKLSITEEVPKGLTIAEGTSNFHIGADKYHSYSGLVDQIMVYGAALNEKQVVSLARGKEDNLPEGLLAFWDFEGGNVNDSSGAGRHGTLVGEAKIVPVQTLENKD